mgnify:CR=1 FL=1|tara:strand:+ start:52 stop:282 length:231 start_codon:yes stop_codon:yes gene_type:complete
MTKRKRIHNVKRTSVQRSPIKHIDEQGQNIKVGENNEVGRAGWFSSNDIPKFGFMAAAGAVPQEMKSTDNNSNHSH